MAVSVLDSLHRDFFILKNEARSQKFVNISSLFYFFLKNDLKSTKTIFFTEFVHDNFRLVQLRFQFCDILRVIISLLGCLFDLFCLVLQTCLHVRKNVLDIDGHFQFLSENYAFRKMRLRFVKTHK